MDKAKLHQIRNDVYRLQNAAERYNDLYDAYINTHNDLHIAQQGLKVIAIWAMHMRLTDPLLAVKDARNIHDRAMDALALISDENKMSIPK